jgi:hypothetical protein
MKTSRRGIKNYTTTISVEKTINEIELLLTRYGARKILKEYDDNQVITHLTFMIKHDTGFIPIRLPSNPEKVVLILNEKAETGDIAKRYKNDMEQASRIMWRVILDWVDSQMTMIEIGQRTLLEIFFADICPVGSKETLSDKLKREELPYYLIEEQSEQI